MKLVIVVGGLTIANASIGSEPGELVVQVVPRWLAWNAGPGCQCQWEDRRQRD